MKKKTLKSIFFKMWHSSGVNVPFEKYFFTQTVSGGTGLCVKHPVTP